MTANSIAEMFETKISSEDGFIGRLQLDARRSATTNLGPAETDRLSTRPVFGAVYKRSGSDAPCLKSSSSVPQHGKHMSAMIENQHLSLRRYGQLANGDVFGDEPTHWLNYSMWNPVFDLDTRYVTSISSSEGKQSVLFVDRDTASIVFKIHYASVPTGVFTFVEDSVGDVLFHTDDPVTLVDTLHDLGLLCFRHPSNLTQKEGDV